MDATDTITSETGIQRAIRIVGGAAVLAKMLGESTQTICNWSSRGAPANKCIAIESATGVDRRELRPADWRDYWPELTERAPA